MAKVLVTESSLQDIADAIRTKNGSTDKYTPAEMSDAIEAIPTGITPTGTKQINIAQNGTTTEDVTNYANAQINVNVPSSSPTLVTKTITENGTYNASSDNADGYSSVTVNVSGGGGGGEDTLSDFIVNNLTSFTLPAGAYLSYALAGASNLKTLIFPNSKVSIPTSFAQGTGIEHLFIHGLSGNGGQNGFQNCASLLTAVISGTTENFTTGQYFFRNDTSLQAIDFDCNIYTNTFISCSALTTVVLRKSTVATLQNINAFSGTPFASGGTGGTIYVPESLLSSYQSASGWSTILGYANNSIKKIEGSIYETQYVDGTPISS